MGFGGPGSRFEFHHRLTDSTKQSVRGSRNDARSHWACATDITLDLIGCAQVLLLHGQENHLVQVRPIPWIDS